MITMTEFDHREVTVCGWQDVKIQLLTNLLVPSDSEPCQDFDMVIIVLLLLMMKIVVLYNT